MLLGPTGVWQLFAASNAFTELRRCSLGVHNQAAFDSLRPVHAHRQVQVRQPEDHARIKPEILRQGRRVRSFMSLASLYVTQLMIFQS